MGGADGREEDEGEEAEEEKLEAGAGGEVGARALAGGVRRGSGARERACKRGEDGWGPEGGGTEEVLTRAVPVDGRLGVGEGFPAEAGREG